MPRSSHKDCDHPSTMRARYACRRGTLDKFFEWWNALSPEEQALECLPKRTPEGMKAQQGRYKPWSTLTPERCEVLKQRRRDAWANRTQEQIEAERRRDREYKRKYRVERMDDADFREKLNARRRQRLANDPDARARHLMRKAERRRLRIDTASADPIVYEEIFERDRWVCQLCFKEVDALTFWPHKMSPTLDHIVPLSKGGTHTEDNVQLAHFSCNSSKCNRYEVAL